MNLKLTEKIYIRDLYRGISDTKKCSYRKANIVMDQKSDLVTDSHGIWVGWRKCFSQLWNVHKVNELKQTEIHT